MKEVKLEEAAYQFEAKMSLRQAIPLGLQHVCAMFVGNLTPLLIITSARSPCCKAPCSWQASLRWCSCSPSDP